MMPRSRFLALLLSLFPLLSHAAVFGPYIPVSPPEPGRAYGTQSAARVASNGATSYAVWITGDDLYGRMPGGDSAALRTPPTHFGKGASPDVASAGGGYLVAWSYGGRTFVRTLSSDGTATSDARDINMSSCGRPTLEGSGTSYILVDSAPYSDCQPSITILDAQGAVVSTSLVSTSHETRLAAAPHGDGFVVASSATMLEPSLHTTIAVRTIAASGTASDPVNVPMDGTPAHSLAVASSGSETLVVWGSEYGLRAQRLDRLLQPAGGTIPIRYDNASVEAVVAAGDSFWILTRGLQGDLSLARVRGGQVEGERIALSFATTSGGDLALAGSHLIAVWGEGSYAPTPYAADNGDIRSATIDAATGTVEGASVVSLSAHGQTNPDVHFDGSGFAAAWQEATGDADLVMFRRFDPNGAAIDAAPVTVSEPLHHASMPAVAFNGSVYLVVWQEGSWDSMSIMGLHLLPNGQPVEAQPFLIAETANVFARPRAASNGRDFLVIWAGAAVVPTHTHTSDVFARKVGAAGPPAEGAVLVSLQSSDSLHRDPDVVWDGYDYMAVWGTSFWFGGHSATRTSILAATLDDEGNPRERITIVPEVSTGYVGYGPPGEWVSSPRIAWSGNVHMVVWQSSANGIVAIAMEDVATAPPPVARRRTLRRPQGFSLAEAPASSPAIAWDGSSFVVSWSETTVVEQHDLTRLVAAHVPEALPAAEPIGRIEVSGPAQWNGSTSAVAAGNGITMFAFARYETLEPYSGAPRVYVRVQR